MIHKVPYLLLFLLVLNSCVKNNSSFKKSWTTIDDRVWVGSEFWSNRLQDWRIQNKRLECIANNSALLMRTTHLINCRLDSTEGDFYARMNVGALQSKQNPDAACGFLIGAGAELDVWGASLVQQKKGKDAGLFTGISADGVLFIRDMETRKDLKRLKTSNSDKNQLIIATTKSKSTNKIELTFGEATLTINVDSKRLIGNIALVSDPGTGNNPGSFWFNNLEVSGSKLKYFEETAGPIMSSQYTLSSKILKITAQMAPIAKSDPQEVFLEVSDKGNWSEIASTPIITPGYTATFRISDWDSSINTKYRIKYRYQSSTNPKEINYWYGTIKHDPVEKEEIVIAGFTGNHNVAKPALSGTKEPYNFDLSTIWYPHNDIVKAIQKHDPDVLFFSGDQIYEGGSPTDADRENYELDYLYKWYLYCLAYRDLTKDIPTVSIPDDHDVFQGNLWGQSGRPTKTDNVGGYVHPAWFANMVERTQCSNLPDAYDATPIDQNIGVYYTSMTYGGIGFAILEDRKFKSGCADHSFSTAGRPDHIIDPKFDIRKIDLPGKKLLGERQLDFLNTWTTDWKGQDMKIALSQTVFANMATHHGPKLERVIADLDSNGWPQSGRNRAIDALRKGFVFHLAGDQHLGSIVRHGVDNWNDAIYSFCVPSIANFYPRAWYPETRGIDRHNGEDQNMGKHKDGFGNLVTVHAVTNPTGFTKKSTFKEPQELHDKMPGYGIVRMNKTDRTIRMECWPRYANPENDNEQYVGWPKVINQLENYEKEAFGYLPNIKVEGIENPVIQVIDQVSNELVYSLRMKGNEFRPKVFKQSEYKITIKDTDKGSEKVYMDIVIDKNEKAIINVKF